MQLLSLFVLVGVARAQISFETEVGLPSESCLELLFKFAGAPAPTRVSCSLPGDPASRALLPEHRIDGSSRWQLRICAPDERPLLVLGPTSNSFACVFEGAAVNATVRVASDPIRILPRGQTGAVTVWSVSVRRRPRQPMPRILDVAAVATQPGAHCLQVAWDPGWDEDGQMALVDRLCRSKLDNALPKGTISQPGNNGGLRAAVFGKPLNPTRLIVPEAPHSVQQPRTWGDRFDRIGRLARRMLSNDDPVENEL